MKKSSKYMLSGSFIVAAVIAITYFVPGNNQGLNSVLSPSSSSTLTISEGSLEISEELAVGDAVQVLSFTLTPSASEAAVSELSFRVRASGLKAFKASDWKVYPVSNGSVDLNKQVGKGSTFSGTSLKVSMYDQSYGSTYGQKLSGAEEFVLVAKISDDGNDNSNSLRISSNSTSKWIARSKVKKTYSSSSWYTTLKGSVTMALNS